MPKTHAIILASGLGVRSQYHIPKQFIKIAGRKTVEHTLQVFQDNPHISNIIIVVHPHYRHLLEEILIQNKFSKVSRVLNGGESRRESSYIGIQSIEANQDSVLIHDAVRPFVSHQIIDRCVAALKKYKAVDVAVPSADTIINIDKRNFIDHIPPRAFMMRGQTPQAFQVGVIKKAHQIALKDKNLNVTDDCGLVLKYDLAKIFVVEGEDRNIKITYPEDVFLAEKIFQLKTARAPKAVSLSGLKDKVVIVFGASRGIGLHTVQLAKKYKAKVYGFSRKNNVDVAQYPSVSKALRYVYKKEKRIDYIVNTAGILRLGRLEARGIESIAEEIKTNYLGAIHVIKAGAEYLKKSKGGVLLYTSSSYTRGRALYAVYSSTKAAIVNLIQGMAEEFAVDDIKINAINPERTATPMRLENFGNEPPELLLKPEKVAAISLKTLLSNLNGEVIDVKR